MVSGVREAGYARSDAPSKVRNNPAARVPGEQFILHVAGTGTDEPVLLSSWPPACHEFPRFPAMASGEGASPIRTSPPMPFPHVGRDHYEWRRGRPTPASQQASAFRGENSSRTLYLEGEQNGERRPAHFLDPHSRIPIREYCRRGPDPSW